MHQPPVLNMVRSYDVPLDFFSTDDSDMLFFVVAGIYPGDKKIHFVTELNTHNPSDNPVIPIFRIMDENGTIRPGATLPDIDQETLIKAYKTMIRIQIMDAIFYESQRQGRISFYMTSWGEEATHLGSVMALNPDDEIFAQYREQGTLMWRGFTLQQFADQCFSNEDDLGKGRQMPVHYGCADLHFQTVSSPLATQLPQASGAAYACKMEGKGRVVTCYFGEGAASEGDFHAGLNFAATLECPVIFFCRNNGYAISTPVREQYRGDGIAARGLAYGMHTIRVDGNDIFAVYTAMSEARKIATGKGPDGKIQPVLIEAMTYRESHHSTSDDSTRYRDLSEIKMWRENSNPIKRLRAYLESKGLWDAQKEEELAAAERQAVLDALAQAEAKRKPALEELFTDVYDTIPEHLANQEKSLRQHIDKYPGNYSL